MNPDEIKQLIAETLASFKDDILSEVRKADQGVASNLSKELKKIQETFSQAQVQQSEADPQETPADGEPEGKRLTTKALQTQINELRNQLAEQEKKAIEAEKAREQKAFESDRTVAIASTVSSHSLNHPSAVQRLFAAEYESKLQREGDKWFIDDDGKVVELSELFKNYLNTDEGKYFVPATPVRGAGTTEKSKPVTTSATNGKNLFGAAVAAQLAESL